jgi:hypothetical protein
VGPSAVLGAVVKRKIPSPSRKSNPRTSIVQPVAQCYIPTEPSRLLWKAKKINIITQLHFTELLASLLADYRTCSLRMT